MPSNTGGARKPEDEKQLLSELGKLFHLVRAQFRERANANKAQPQGSSSGKKKAAAKRSRTSRKSKAGGTVWITLKGGFASKAVPALSDAKATGRKCVRRGRLAERRRLEVLEAAEAYVASAWDAAQQAGIADPATKKATCDEGNVYLREQFAVAVQMLNDAEKRAPGTLLRRIVETSVSGVASADSRKGNGAFAAAVASDAVVPVEKAKLASCRGGASGNVVISDWEDVARREMEIHQSPFAVNNVNAAVAAELAAEQFKAVVADGGQSLYYRLGEPPSLSPSTPNDIAATKCIIKIRNSQRHKHTAVLATTKAVNYFHSNFGNVLRKELSSAKLPRGGATDDAMDGSHSQQHQQQGGRQQQQQQGGKGKRRGKR